MLIYFHFSSISTSNPFSYYFSWKFNLMCSKKGISHALNLDSFAFNSDFYIISHLTLSITFLDDKSYENY